MEFSPAVYEHAAALIGRSPWEVSRDAELLFTAHDQAYRRYRHSPIVPGIDIYNLEAESYGATVCNPGENSTPAISRHPLSAASEILQLDTAAPSRRGRLPMAIATARRLHECHPEADVRVPVSGPFSIASNLVGLETLLEGTLTSPDATREALSHLVDGQITLCRAIAEAGLDISFFESAATPPLLSPRLFRTIVLPPMKRFFDAAEAIIGHPVACIIGGDTTPILPLLLETGTGYVICPSETDQRLFMEKMRLRPDVTVRINMDPGIIASGDIASVYREIDRVAALTMGGGRRCIGTGVLPYETDPGVVLKAREYVHSLSLKAGR